MQAPHSQRSALDAILGEALYSCGAQLAAEGSLLAAVISLKPNLNCNDPLETQYASYIKSSSKRLPHVCAHCGQEDELLPPRCAPAEPAEQYIVVQQICADCKAAGKGWPHGRRKVAPGAGNVAAHGSAGSAAADSTDGGTSGSGRGRGHGCGGRGKRSASAGSAGGPGRARGRRRAST